MKKMITIALAAMIAAGAMAQTTSNDTQIQDNLKKETIFTKIGVLFSRTNKKIENGVVNGYHAIENGVVSGYKATENFFVGGYKAVEDKFVETFFVEDPRVKTATEESVEE